MKMKKNAALVLLSGGQDSATCAAWAAQKFASEQDNAGSSGGSDAGSSGSGNTEVSLNFLSFQYGQRHVKELVSAKKIAALFGGVHEIKSLEGIFQSESSALTDQDADLETQNPDTGLPNTFVPGRNLVFLAIASAYALSRGIGNLVTGVCQTDFSGYPDCRQDTIDQLESSIYLGNRGLLERPEDFKIHTPLMDLTKAETIRMAQELPQGMDALSLTWTCYKGGELPCSTCPSCVLRIKGFEEAGILDPALPSLSPLD